MKYFSTLGKIAYNLNDNTVDAQTATNILKRSTFLKEILENTAIAYDYEIKDGDTPEIIAHKLYGDVNRHWIVLLYNNILNPYYEFPLTQDELNIYIQNKYGYDMYTAMQTIHHYEKRTTTNISKYGILQSTNTNRYTINSYYVDPSTGAIVDYNTLPTIGNPVIPSIGIPVAAGWSTQGFTVNSQSGSTPVMYNMSYYDGNWVGFGTMYDNMFVMIGDSLVSEPLTWEYYDFLSLFPNDYWWNREPLAGYSHSTTPYFNFYNHPLAYGSYDNTTGQQAVITAASCGYTDGVGNFITTAYLVRSVDNGSSWHSVHDSTPFPNENCFIADIKYVGNGKWVALLLTYFIDLLNISDALTTSIIISENNGQTWGIPIQIDYVSLPAGSPPPMTFSALQFSNLVIAPTAWYVFNRGSGNFWISMDQGISWSPGVGTTVFNNGILENTGANTWSALGTVEYFNGNLIATSMIDTGDSYSSNNCLIYVSATDGASWDLTANGIVDYPGVGFIRAAKNGDQSIMLSAPYGTTAYSNNTVDWTFDNYILDTNSYSNAILTLTYNPQKLAYYALSMNFSYENTPAGNNLYKYVETATTAHDPSPESESTFSDGTTINTTTLLYAVSVFEYEEELNEAKRTIKLIDPSYIAQIENEFKVLMSDV